MIGQLVPRPGEAARILRGADPLAPSLPRHVERAINREAAWGLVNAARAQAVDFVTEARIEALELATERGMLGLDRLQRLQAAMAQADPVQADRLAGYVDEYYYAHAIRSA